MKRIILFIVVALNMLLTSAFTEQVYAWDNKVTHKDISKYASESSTLSEDKGNYLKKLGFDAGLTTKLKWVNPEEQTTETKPIKEWIAEGSRLEDAGDAANMLADYGRSDNHFHNPLKPWSSAGLSDILDGKSSLLWAQDGVYQQGKIEGDWSWLKVRNLYYLALTSGTDSERQTNFAKTFRGLGQQMHLVQDKAVPYHVRNDAHPLDSALGRNPQFGSLYFETWAKMRLPNITALKAFAPAPSYPQVSLSTSVGGLVPITQFFDTDQYDGINPSTGLAIGLAEYTNSNFLSDETIFTEGSSIDDKHYFPYPRKTSTNLQSYIDQNLLPETIFAEDGQTDVAFWIKKDKDGEVIDHFVKPTYFFNDVDYSAGGYNFYRKTLYLDEKCHEDYAKLLIPRAVGFSAGLLNYFFRGQIDMVADPSNPGEYLIKNLSNENMSGTFSLYYDDKNDNRILITSWENLSINANSQSAPVTFTEPASPEPKEKGKYILIFRGTQGSEADAVAGKVVTIKGEVNGRMVVLYDILTPSVTVKTKTGPLRTSLPTDGFWNAISVRFDVDDPDTFVVLALHYDCTSNSCSGRYDFHKFFIDETKKIVSYQGVALSIPIPKENVTQSNICSYNEDWSDKCGTKRRFTTQTNVEPLEVWDFYIKGGAITPYGGFSEVERTRFHDCWDIWYKTANGGCQRGIERPYTSCGYPSELEGAETRGIYFGSPVVSTTHSWAGGFVDVSRGCFSVDVRSAHIPRWRCISP